MKKILVACLLITPLCSFSQSRGRGHYNTFFKGKTKIENPFGLRDPFKSPIRKKVKKDHLKKGRLKDGVYTNLESIEGASLSKLKVVGIVFGKKRRAMAKFEGKAKSTFILKEGMILGDDKAELKAILPGGVIFVEKIVNVYGQEEFLETVVPLSQ